MEGLWEDLQNSIEATAYLNAALEDGSPDVFLLALRDVAKAREKAGELQPSTTSQENLLGLLSETDNPPLASVLRFLDDLGLTLAVKMKGHVAA